MTTVAQKQATPAQLLTDLASAMTGLAEWSDGDTALVNDQSTDDWFNNARVLQNSQTGTYLLLYIAHGDSHSDGSGDQVAGIRAVRSDSWDGTNNVPAGKTTVNSRDPFNANVTNDVSASFEENGAGSSSSCGVWFFNSYSPYSSRSGFATNADVTYFLSATAGGVAGGAWNSTHTSGSCGWYAWEYVASKFWSDGYLPAVHEYSVSNASGSSGHLASYAYRWINATYGQDDSLGNSSGMDDDKWGYINADADDDTFFVQYPVFYSDQNETQPVAYSTQAIANQKSEGAAHGDTITYDGQDYRILQQSGNGESSNNSLSFGLRYN